MPMGFKFDESEIMDQMIVEVGSIIEELANEIAEMMKELLIKEGHVYTGRLAETIKVVDGDTPMEYFIGADAPYTLMVEFGTFGRSVPFEIIAEWVENKIGLTGKERDDVAWAIVKKINNKGIKGVRFAYRAADRVARKWGGSQ